MKVIRISAAWCPACIVMDNRWKKIMNELGWVEFESYDYDQDAEAIARYDIGKDMPVFIFLGKAGTEILRLSGEIDRREMISLLKENREK